MLGVNVVSHKDFAAIAVIQQTANERDALRVTGHVHLLPQLIVRGLDPKQVVLAVASQLGKFKEKICVVKCPCGEKIVLFDCWLLEVCIYDIIYNFFSFLWSSCNSLMFNPEIC